MPTYFELEPGRPFDPLAVVTHCIESGARSLLLDEGALPAEFVREANHGRRFRFFPTRREAILWLEWRARA